MWQVIICASEGSYRESDVLILLLFHRQHNVRLGKLLHIQHNDPGRALQSEKVPSEIAPFRRE